MIMVVGLRERKKVFSTEKLDEMIMTVAVDRDKTTDWCKYAVFGEPLEPAGDWVKINFWCADGRKSQSTLSLKAIEDKSFGGVMREYARIVGVVGEVKWPCWLNDKTLINDWNKLVKGTDRIDCYEKYR